MRLNEDALSSAVAGVLLALGELEVDNDETVNSMEQNIEHIMSAVLEQIYSSSIADQTMVLGILESIKMKWYLTHFHGV